MRRELELRTEDGTTLRASLHAPAETPAPGIVMAHGFSGVKEQIDHYAVAFADAGFSALVFDHRGFGASDGGLRLEVDPARQIADWRDVLTAAEALPEVDAGDGLGVWGSSFAGGLAMTLAADDDRVRCVVAQIPNVGNHRGRHLYNAGERATLNERIRADRAARLAGEPAAMIPVFTSDPGELCALPPAVSSRYIEAAEAASPTWRNEVTLRSVVHMLGFEPGGWIRHIAPTPLLMIVAANDICTPVEGQLAAYEEALEPKRLVVHPGGHFDTYIDHFAQTSHAAIEWFDHLRTKPVGERRDRTTARAGA